MQVFRGMDVGTAKPDRGTRERFAYHMIDLAEPSEEFTVAEFRSIGTNVLDDIERSGRSVVIAGGSGLHFRSLVDPLVFPPTDERLRGQLEMTPIEDLRTELLEADGLAGAAVDMANPRRVLRAVEIFRLSGLTPTERAGTKDAEAVRAYRPIRPFTAIGVDPGPILFSRIEERFDAMLDAGFMDEVIALAQTLGRTARQAVGYRELLGVVEDGMDLSVARDLAIRATNALAKRQRTFFRRDPRIRWIPWHHDAERMLVEVFNHREEGST